LVKSGHEPVATIGGIARPKNKTGWSGSCRTSPLKLAPIA